MRAYAFCLFCFSPFAYAEPPREIPLQWRDAFTMQGIIPVFDWYLDDTYPSSEFAVILPDGQRASFFPRALINEYIARVQRKETFYYEETDLWLYEALEKYPIRGKEVAIIGSTTPWYESVVLAYGGVPTTIEYNQIVTNDHRLRLRTLAEFEQHPQPFDLILSISSIEHDGLGRYGDPINPNGDLEFMSKVKAKYLKAGGSMLLAVPIGQDCLYWNAHRVYGRKRLPLLLKEWDVVDTFGWKQSELMGTLGESYQPVFYLTPKREAVRQLNEQVLDKKIVSCKIVGGLGNQMFQIANAMAIAWDHGYKPIFPKIAQSESYLSPRPVYWDTVFHQLDTYNPTETMENMFHFTSLLEESSFSYKKIDPTQDRIKLSGYFSSYKYFDHHREKIRATFRLPIALEAIVEERYQAIISSETSETVSIHIRLDDTFIAPIPGVIDFWKEPYDRYYDSAIALFPGDVTFVVFSDNCAWSRNYMKDKLHGRHAVYVCDRDYLDLFLMARCKHNIIVNSTYSWWGAYLNRNPDKVVVSPKFWQARGNTPYRPDLLMPGWQLLENVH